MKYDLIIIGSGPAGYVGAIRAGQTGLKTLVIDKDKIGGMCLNWGCIPSKVRLESAKLYHKITQQSSQFGIQIDKDNEIVFDWDKVKQRSDDVVTKLGRGIAYLFKKNGVEYLNAEAKILKQNQVQAGNQILETEYIMIATGSRPKFLEKAPKLIGLERLISLNNLPQKPIVWGSGSVAYETVQFFKLIGTDPIWVLDDERLLFGLDSSLESFAAKKLKKDKIRTIPASELRIEQDQIWHSDSELDFDALINASMRKAMIPSSELTFDLQDGFIQVDEEYRTNHKNIFVAGDANGLSSLAHAASAQALSVIDIIHKRQVDAPNPHLWPVNIYSDPEIAQIGQTEEELKEQNIQYKTLQYSLNANGKALAEGNSDGFLRLLYEPKYSQVLGVQIVSAHATDMIAEAALLMEMEGTVYDLFKTVHAHPTISEVFMDAAKGMEE